MISADPHEQRFAAWLEEHGAILHKLSRAYAPESADEDDLRQEMMVQLWRSVPRFRDQAKPSTWIYRVCLNTALTWRRTERRREARVVAQSAPVEAAVCEAHGPARTQEQQDLMAKLMQAVRRLRPADRSLVVLALDGLSYREIGEVTGMKENHVGVALNRARQKLSALLKEVGDEL
ncbi:RNA polymerase sigma factor [Actomonas aquatica]|uniref:Sigma-70 family RNA polymerase sigma factor n=1 Tax=Actomonas aquatica TaxID=2866162 RepID=A0ABZ1CD72_9BACT|nr:sigma-70 family RNA polymerase sigma factor [Opitutus sp. WL0086]WRQ89356.1 sigma-70 family RNA polymerase sigma factor [Opitutus sp. WL0086]